MRDQIVFNGKWAYFEGLAYCSKDIQMLTTSQRNVKKSTELTGQELEAHVVKCLRTPEYKFLGRPMNGAEVKMVEELLLTAA
jgi:hypothetical protein